MPPTASRARPCGEHREPGEVVTGWAGLQGVVAGLRYGADGRHEPHGEHEHRACAWAEPWIDDEHDGQRRKGNDTTDEVVARICPGPRLDERVVDDVQGDER